VLTIYATVPAICPRRGQIGNQVRNSRDTPLLTCVFTQICYDCPTMVIRMRHTRSHTANRRSHHALKSPEFAVCKNCGGNHRPHHMCLDCGFYNGKMVLDLAAKKSEREARMNAKRDAIKSQVTDTTPVAQETK
jgi:large subunit ribosomal protein L32